MTRQMTVEGCKVPGTETEKQSQQVTNVFSLVTSNSRCDLQLTARLTSISNGFGASHFQKGETSRQLMIKHLISTSRIKSTQRDELTGAISSFAATEDFPGCLRVLEPVP